MLRVLKTPLEEPHGLRPVPESDYDEFLCLYPRDRRYLKDISYADGTLIASITPHKIDYSVIEVDYYTLTQVSLLLSQGSYLLGGLAIQDPLFEEFQEDDYSAYIKALREGRTYYRTAHLDFRQKISNAHPQHFRGKLLKARRMSGTVVAKMAFDLAHSAARGEVLVTFSLL